jgi:hypothetical protein
VPEERILQSATFHLARRDFARYERVAIDAQNVGLDPESVEERATKRLALASRLPNTAALLQRAKLLARIDQMERQQIEAQRSNESRFETYDANFGVL